MRQAFPILFSILLIITSCTKEVNIDLPEHIAELVVDGTIETNKNPIVLLSRSADIYASTDISSYLSYFVLDAEVKVICNEDTTELSLFTISELPIESQEKLAEMLRLNNLNELQELPLLVYSSIDLIGEVNNTYELSILFNGKNYNGKTKILEPTALDALYWELEPGTIEYGYSWAILSDPVNQFDGYKWEVKRTNLNFDGLPKDDIFKRARGGTFNDQFFDGMTFDFFFENPMKRKDSTHLLEYKRYYRFGDTVVVKFSKMDEAVYEFMENKYTQLSTAGNPFATPINIPSNITGGALGVWAGYSPTLDTLICQP